jgi:hypothetical protein
VEAILLGGRLDPQRPDQGVARAVHQVDEGREQPAERLQRTGDAYGGRLGALDGNALGGELPHHDMQNGDDREGDDDRRQGGAARPQAE